MKEKSFFQYPLYGKPAILKKEIFLFVHSLLKDIFIEHKNKKLSAHLNKWIENINTKIIKKKEKFLSTDYDIKNLRNIIKFVQSQNMKYCGDIIESILINLFSLAFKSEQDNSFGKYIFNNLTSIREHQDPDLLKWIKKEKLKPREFKDLEGLFKTDKEEDINNSRNQIRNQNQSIFYDFLLLILKSNYSYDILANNKKSKSVSYISNINYFFSIMNKIIYDKTKINYQSILDKDIATNSIMSMVSNLFSSEKKPITHLIRLFFTEVYIFYQNKYSPLLPYTQPLENYATIPFVYDLRGACIEGRYSHPIFCPLMVQDFYSKIFLKQNNFREMGMFELGKLFVFNENIKYLESETCLIKPHYIDYMIYAMGLFDNHSVESFDISYNYLKEISEEFIYKILLRFKNLKTLNISANDIKGGASSIFVILKKLYRTKKTKLENLILNKCILDNSSLYELGELLKCKYCKLKLLVLNNNSLPKNCRILKKLKQNKFLEEIYLNKMDLDNSYVDDILRLISNTNIRYLYLYKNKMNNFDDFLRIISRTKIIKNGENNNIIIFNEETSLINLDLSNNDYFLKNSEQINLLNNLIKSTSLYCLDISHILLGPNPDRWSEKWPEKSENKKYKNSVDEIKEHLDQIKNDYSKLIRDIRSNKVDVENYSNLEGEMKNKIKDEILKGILKDKNAKYSAFLHKVSENIIKNEEIFENKEENVTKMVNYLIYKRAQKKLESLIPKKHQKKLIII